MTKKVSDDHVEDGRRSRGWKYRRVSSRILGLLILQLIGNTVFVRHGDVAQNPPPHTERVQLVLPTKPVKTSRLTQSSCYQRLARQLRQAAPCALELGSKRLLGAFRSTWNIAASLTGVRFSASRQIWWTDCNKQSPYGPKNDADQRIESAASRMSLVVGSGWDIIATCDASTSRIDALARCAMNRSVAGGLGGRRNGVVLHGDHVPRRDRFPRDSPDSDWNASFRERSLRRLHLAWLILGPPLDAAMFGADGECSTSIDLNCMADAAVDVFLTACGHRRTAVGSLAMDQQQVGNVQ